MEGQCHGHLQGKEADEQKLAWRHTSGAQISSYLDAISIAVTPTCAAHTTLQHTAPQHVHDTVAPPPHCNDYAGKGRGLNGPIWHMAAEDSAGRCF